MGHVRSHVGAPDRLQPIASDDGALSFAVLRAEDGVYVERTQPLEGIGRLSHLMLFDSIGSFDRAYEADELRFTYPLVYWRLRRAVEDSLGCCA